jgi:demethylmenaquinone methyltransferase/2-methoxy-6-polyprenyl-1,4-benzoquinol methylase
MNEASTPTSTALVQGDAKRAMVRQMFDAISPRYDVVNRMISVGLDNSWRRRTVKALGLPARSRVLDLACGTGDFCRLLSENDIEVVGIDMSEGMLRAARTDAGLVLGDAASLPFSEGAFDGVVSGFALRNFVALEAVCSELARVVRPGGRIGLLDVAIPTGVIGRTGYRVWFEHAVPAIGGLFSDAAAYRYLPASVEYLPAPERIRLMLRNAGFSAVGRRTFTAGTTQLFTATRAGSPQSFDRRRESLVAS